MAGGREPGRSTSAAHLHLAALAFTQQLRQCLRCRSHLCTPRTLLLGPTRTVTARARSQRALPSAACRHISHSAQNMRRLRNHEERESC